MASTKCNPCALAYTSYLCDCPDASTLDSFTRERNVSTL